MFELSGKLSITGTVRHVKNKGAICPFFAIWKGQMKKELSARIQKAIEDSMLSYTAISGIIGTVSPQAVRAWAVGLATPTNENIVLLAKATKADEVWLLTGKKNKNFAEEGEIQDMSNFEDSPKQQIIDNVIKAANNFERVKAVIRLTNGEDQKVIFALYLSLNENQEIPLERLDELEKVLNQSITNVLNKWFIKTETAVKPIIPLFD